MNKKGQTLIIFVILIPIFLGLIALVVDIGTIYYEKTRSLEVTKTIIQESMGSTEEFIFELCRKNKIPLDNLEVELLENKITIKNSYEIDSIFGSIIGFKKYKIKINITGIKKNEKIIFE